MDALRKLAQFCRLHYEKILMVIALMGLGFGIWYVLSAGAKERDKIQTYLRSLRERKGAPVKQPDLSEFAAQMRKATNPPAATLSGSHNLFNPVRWRRRGPNEYIKEVRGDEVVKEFTVAGITPLRYLVTFIRPAGSTYFLSITNEVVSKTAGTSQYYSLNATNRPGVILREVKGPAEAPTELVLELKDTGERVSVTPDKPYARVDAYEADVRTTEGGNFSRQRVGAKLRLAEEDYEILAINATNLVLLAPNKKQYVLRFNPPP